MKRIIALAGIVVALGLVSAAGATVNSVTPSTNAQNQANGWAYVSVTAGPGTATLTFHTSRAFYSCFEYRTDGDTSQKISDTNYNTLITDGLYPYTCVHGGSAASPVTATVTVSAKHYVEVRMVFGAETDERFDWTRFDVLPTKDACKHGGWAYAGWASYGFPNQGQCIKYANTGK